MNRTRKKNQVCSKPTSIRILEQSALRGVVGGDSVRITGQTPDLDPTTDNREF